MVSRGKTKISICPTCGRPLPSVAKFCGFDGTALGGDAGARKPVVPPKRVCPLCHSEYPPYAIYCTADASRLRSLWTPQPEPQDKKTDSAAPAITSISTATAATQKDLVDPLSSETNLVGRVLANKYLVEDLLGEGGMAVVYKALHTGIDKPVVLKVMRGWLLTNESSRQRFERECKVTAKLNHPNIVSVYDVGFINDKQPYMVMEYIKGESLRQRIDREGALPLSHCATIIIQICRGLQEAHDAGIIHRDLKPHNIILQERSDRPDWVKIVDFGIAHLVEGSQRLTKEGSAVGTPEYISPEQLRNTPIDQRADLYSLGVMLYEMLTARLPFDAETTEAILLKQLMERADPPSKFRRDLVRGSGFDQVVARALEKSPEDRYQTATEMRLDLEQVLNQVLLRRGLAE